MSDLITIVVPVYNVESWKRAVTSIHNQSHTNLEILLQSMALQIRI